MLLDKITAVMEEHRQEIAIVTGTERYTYGDLLESQERAAQMLTRVPEGSVFCVRGEFTIDTIGLMLALINHRCIYVPLAKEMKNVSYYIETAQVEYFYDAQEKKIQELEVEVTYPLLLRIKSERKPGLVFFSSGTTGEPKAAVHDMMPYIHRFEKRGKTLRSMAFLLFDHAGGFNTIMHSLSNGGLMVTLDKRTPDEVCRAIEKYRLELLPTSPTFLQMLLLGRYYEKYDLSSLKIISYGTEPMPESTLHRLHKTFPEVRLKQTYGLTELGAMRTQSKSSDSLWMKIGGDEHHQTKVVDGILYIKSDMAMLGYLNAESPFDEEGWYNTGDRVEVDGDYFLVKGRESELINVGGQKVYPAEIESVLMEIGGVLDAIVVAIPNPVMGQVVEARIYKREDVDKAALTEEIRKVCRARLERYKRPVKIRFSEAPFYSARFKKKR